MKTGQEKRFIHCFYDSPDSFIFIFNPAWSDEKVDDIQNQYCWIKGKNFHDFKDAIKKTV